MLHRIADTIGILTTDAIAITNRTCLNDPGWKRQNTAADTDTTSLIMTEDIAAGFTENDFITCHLLSDITFTTDTTSQL